jgi:hypothetical protein
MIRRAYLFRSFFLIGIIGFLQPRQLSAAEELLKVVRAGHLSTTQALHTFSCKISVKLSTDPPEVHTGEYWRSHDAIRVRSLHNNLVSDRILQNSKIRKVYSNPRKSGASGVNVFIEPFKDLVLGDCDVWDHALLLFQGPPPNSGLMTFDRLLETKTQVKKVDRQHENGRELIVVRLEHEWAVLTIMFDPQLNWLVRKYTYATIVDKPETRTRSEFEVVQFRELASGMYFPVHIKGRHLRVQSNRVMYTQQTTLSDIRINHRIPDDTFHIPLPDGTVVEDLIQGKKYTVDGKGNPVGPMKDLAEMKTPSRHVTPRSQTLEEPKSITEWILPVSAVVLVVGLGLGAYRRWKSR